MCACNANEFIFIDPMIECYWEPLQGPERATGASTIEASAPFVGDEDISNLKPPDPGSHRVKRGGGPPPV